ncbi:hypothetical protein RKD19_008228 [Streptomyces canus]
MSPQVLPRRPAAGLTAAAEQPASPTSLTRTMDSCGRYFLSFVVDTEPDTHP